MVLVVLTRRLSHRREVGSLVSEVPDRLLKVFDAVVIITHAERDYFRVFIRFEQLHK